MTRSAFLIFNPVAGQSNAEQDLEKIKAILDPEIALDIHFTTPDIEAAQLAKEAIADGAEAIIASGGDGTLSDVAGAIIGTGIPLGIIARGTANAFANALGIPTQIEAACKTILAGETRTVDAASCDGRPMVLLAGIGFEAETVERADRAAKDRLGIFAYVLAGLDQLRNLPRFEVEIETEDRIIKSTASAVTIANVAPPTSFLAHGPAGIVCDDGLLDLTIVSPAGFLSAIAASYNLLSTALSGEPSMRDDVGYLRSSKVKVTADPPQKIVIDGEIVGTTPIAIECLTHGLTIFVPKAEDLPPAEKLDGLPEVEIISKNNSIEETKKNS
jgi:YegS/Rv2252/BmrU family lipid kinase